MQPEAICCNECGKVVSNAIPPPGKSLVVRAWVECPECIESKPDMEDPEVLAAAFVAQASRATLKQLIAIGEAANDEKNRRLMADPEAEPDFAGADADVIRKAFVAQCRADGRAKRVRSLAYAPVNDRALIEEVLKRANLLALLEAEAGSEEGKP